MRRAVAIAAVGMLAFPPLFILAVGGKKLTAQALETSITTTPGKLGDLLRQWWRDGTAAGNSGDFYDNRDGGHSELALEPYPQLKKIIYTQADISAKRHWGIATLVRPGVVFGNSSTAAGPTAGGSGPRTYYVQSAGMNFLFKKYVANNLYVYPEHRDHDPGHNGIPDGYGDLYPTNTPYLIISQGSSGSDQPFLRALPLALAALRPEVKKKLVETGLLMPTIQMLFRSTNRQLATPDAYLSGQAHPTVFEGSWVNELGLVQAAHALQLDNLPPLVVLKVLEEDEPVLGQDFFEPSGTEKLADTPAVIARVIRGKEYRRRLVVSAQKSVDLNKKPLKLSWVVLRGDKDKITITPRAQDKSVVEIIVPYHDRRPIAPGSAMESNRVDIGVFAHNGTHYSPPAFITFFSLDSEARAYDSASRIREIGYGMGQTHVTVAKWPAFFKALTAETTVAEYFALAEETHALFRAAAAGLNELQQKKASTKEIDEFLDRNGVKSVRATAETMLRNALQDSQLLPRFWKENNKRQYPIPSVAQTWAAMGILKTNDGPPVFKLLDESPTAYEKMLIERGNARFLAHWLLPDVLTVTTTANFVDQRLATPKVWRDVYHYDERGECTGWTRYRELFYTQEYTATGLALLSRDELGRVRQARGVRYVQDLRATPGLNDNPLRAVADGDLVTFEYSGKEDRQGRMVREQPHK